jgi:hypothetical protein
MPEFGGCEVGVLTWWDSMAKTMFENPNTALGVCVSMGDCNFTANALQAECVDRRDVLVHVSRIDPISAGSGTATVARRSPR